MIILWGVLVNHRAYDRLGIEVRNKDLLRNCSSKMKTLQFTFMYRSPNETDELFKTPNRFTSNKLKRYSCYVTRSNLIWRHLFDWQHTQMHQCRAAKYTVLYNDFQIKCFGTQTIERSKVQEWLFIMEK